MDLMTTRCATVTPIFADVNFCESWGLSPREFHGPKGEPTGGGAGRFLGRLQKRAAGQSVKGFWRKSTRGSRHPWQVTKSDRWRHLAHKLTGFGSFFPVAPVTQRTQKTVAPSIWLAILSPRLRISPVTFPPLVATPQAFLCAPLRRHQITPHSPTITQWAYCNWAQLPFLIGRNRPFAIGHPGLPTWAGRVGFWKRKGLGMKSSMLWNSVVLLLCVATGPATRPVLKADAPDAVRALQAKQDELRAGLLSEQKAELDKCEKHLKAAQAGTVDSKLPGVMIEPGDKPSYSFPSAESKAHKIDELKKDIEESKSKIGEMDQMKWVMPIAKSGADLNIDFIGSVPSMKVDRVLNETSFIATVHFIGNNARVRIKSGRVIDGDDATDTTIYFEGFGTKRIVDKQLINPGTFWITGTQQVGSRTLLKAERFDVQDYLAD